MGKFAPPALTALIGLKVYHAAEAFNAGGIIACTNTVNTELTR